MFSIFRKKSKSVTLNALAKGKIVDLSQVPDQVFRDKIVGDGIAFIPTVGDIKSPCKGKVVQIFPTKHAIGIVTDEGLEVLIHLGMDTVELKGKGFESFVEVGQEVEQGTLLASMDLEFIQSQSKDIISVVIITNMEMVKELFLCHVGEEVVDSPIIEIQIK